MRILVTGAAGFVGKSLCEHLMSKGHQVFGTVRSLGQSGKLPRGTAPIVQDLEEPLKELPQVDSVVHLAARVHQMQETESDPFAAYRAANVEVTRRLASWSIENQVRKFVFLSSIKVNGEGQSDPESPRAYTENDLPDPIDPYGVSKWEAEQLLRSLSEKTGLKTVSLRPTLIYGPNVRANFLQLIKLVDSGLPLPFGSIDNRRSFLYIGNLCDAIERCIETKEYVAHSYLLSDGEDASTAELVRQIAAALKRKPRLVRVPVSILRLLGACVGKQDMISRLTGHLHVDSSKFRQDFSWSPPFRFADGLAATVEWYQQLKGITS